MVVSTRSQVKVYPCGDCGYYWYFGKAQGHCKVFGITFDRELSLDKHVNLMRRACNYNLSSLRYIRKYHTIDMETSTAVASSALAWITATPSSIKQ